MKTIEAARPFLDRQRNVAVWYTLYHGSREEIAYANSLFSQTFGIPVEQILAVKRYHLVNPPDTPEQVIEQYKGEDRTAIRTGCFFARNPLGKSQSIEVVKLRFDEGMLGLFRILDAATTDGPTELQNFDRSLLAVVREVRPDLQPEYLA